MTIAEVGSSGAIVRRAFKLGGDVRRPGDFIGAEELSKLGLRTRNGLRDSGFVDYIKEPSSIPAVEGGGVKIPPALPRKMHGQRGGK